MKGHYRRKCIISYNQVDLKEEGKKNDTSQTRDMLKKLREPRLLHIMMKT